MNRPLDTAAKSPTEAALDRTIAMMIREARIDPCAFVRMILMGAAWDPLPEVHRDLQNHLSAHRLALVELPRDHGKTTQVCLRVLWELGRDPNLRIKIVCASESIAIDRSRFLRRSIEQNPRLRRVFPHLGERQHLIHLPHGLIVMSYLRSDGERSIRASYGSISFFESRMPLR